MVFCYKSFEYNKLWQDKGCDFWELSHICFEISLKIVYNRIGFYNQGGGIFKFRLGKVKIGLFDL